MTLAQKRDFSLYDYMFDKYEGGTCPSMTLDVPWCETWYVNLFGFVFGNIKVLEWP